MTNSSYLHYAADCIGGCGNKVLNRTGICKQCRTIECVACGKKFRKVTIDQKTCSACTNKVAKRKHNRFCDVMGEGI